MNREKDQSLAFSVLLTREEYTQTIARIEQENRGRRLPLPTVAGALLTAMGIAGLFFGEAISLSPFAAGCLVLLGLFLACFDGLIAPMLDRAAAAREYDEKEELRLANQITFAGDSVTVKNGRMEGVLPLRMLTRWQRSADLYSLSFGRECHVMLPRRLMDQEQDDRLLALLEREAPEKKIGR